MALSLFVNPMTARSIHQRGLTDDAELQIGRKISLYAISIDNKDFAALTGIFTPNVTVRYPYPPPNDLITSRATLQAVLKAQLKDLVTQHTISTTVIDFKDGREANSTAYLVANYLGQGKLTGQTLAYYGKYLDEWVIDGGEWKSKNRTLMAFVSLNLVSDSMLVVLMTDHDAKS